MVTRGAIAVVLLTGCGVVTGCGGSGSSHSSSAASSASGPPAQRICTGAGHAAGAQLRTAVRTRITDHAAVNIECAIHGHRLSADVVAQVSDQAWTEYDTATVHLSQAYGSGAVHIPADLPHPVPGLTGNVAWVPGQRQLLATNATQSLGGTYLTVTVTGGPAGARLPLARAIARAVLAVAPSGPKLAPPS